MHALYFLSKIWENILILKHIWFQDFWIKDCRPVYKIKSKHLKQCLAQGIIYYYQLSHIVCCMYIHSVFLGVNNCLGFLFA